MGSSLQTHLLSYWVRNKQQFTIEEAVRMLTFDNASAWELEDRGLLYGSPDIIGSGCIALV
jgi:N-acyl-D-amino-acid deacylase